MTKEERLYLTRSTSLSGHPINLRYQKEKEIFVKLLDYYVCKYSIRNTSISLLENYKVLFNSKFESSDDLKILHKHLNKSKFNFKTFKFENNRNLLLSDIFWITELSIKDNILLEFVEHSDKKHHNAILNFNEALQLSEYHKNLYSKNSVWENKPITKILITANMSAGKSTLINALVGKPVAKMSSSACTSDISCIYNKPFEDGYTHSYNGEYDFNSNIQTKEKTHIATFFNSFTNITKPICIIDTPGVNFSQDDSHEKLTKRCIKETNFDKLVYLLNSNYLGTNDEVEHLTYICNNVSHKKIIFVLNKLDNFDENDSVEETVVKQTTELTEIGFKSPRIIPISAYAGLLSKIVNDNREKRALEAYNNFFDLPEYDLGKYVTGQASKTFYEKTGLVNLENILYMEE